MDEEFEGFVVHAYAASVKEGHRIHLIGRLNGGQTFAVVEQREFPHFYLRASETGRASEIVRGEGGLIKDCALRTIDGEVCVRVSWGSIQQREQAARKLAETGTRTYEADLRFQDQFLINRKVHGSITVRGVPRQGKRVNLVFIDPEIGPSEWYPSLSQLSLDIETDPDGQEIYAIGFVFREPWSGRGRREVLFAGSPPSGSRGAMPPAGALGGDLPGSGGAMTSFPDERSMLQGFCERVVQWDPDVITGWNVIDFDFMAISRRIIHHNIPFRIGRSDTPAAFLPGERGRSDTIIVPGRQVLDAVRLVRASPERFEDYALETVARALLGRGKKIKLKDREKRPDAVARMYREDPEGLCRYCLEDAQLVVDILDKTGLMDLTLGRCLLLGVGLDRAWTSIPAFERLYIEALHERGCVAPTLGVDPFPQAQAPGGAILSPQPGLYDNVWVFDFKSLYPTIMRTFNIDPLSFVPPEKAGNLGREERESLLRAPNGACFLRGDAPDGGEIRRGDEPGCGARSGAAILPELLGRFFERRDEAKRRGDHTASHVYKIVMNSFYGVLGARGSRFASGHIAGAITGFGQHLLRWCESYFTRLDYRVIYGDTDSLFVLSGFPQDAPMQELLTRSGELCAGLNGELDRYIGDTFRVRSCLELEFDTMYYKFFLPPVRAAAAQEGRNGRGRAKGYAGLVVPVSELRESTNPGEPSRRIEVVGMEAARRDWTDLARGFQIGLLTLLFRGDGTAAVRGYVRRVVEELYAGALDERLVYRKALRKPIGAYTRSTPPHVKAASMLEPADRRGIICYVWTREGPQPAEDRTSPIDYDHYVEKQLKPIAQSFTEVLRSDLAHLFGEEEQLRLF